MVLDFHRTLNRVRCLDRKSGACVFLLNTLVLPLACRLALTLCCSSAAVLSFRRSFRSYFRSMVIFSALTIPEISNTILTYLLPSLLTLTFELDLPTVSHLTGQALDARLMDREHAVIYSTRRLQAILQPLPVLFCRMLRPHIVPDDGPYCFAVHILQIDVIRCRRIGATSKMWMHMIRPVIKGTGCVRVQSLPVIALDHNVSCTLHFDEDHTDVKTDVTIADYLHVQLFKCPLNSLSHST